MLYNYSNWYSFHRVISSFPPTVKVMSMVMEQLNNTRNVIRKKSPKVEFSKSDFLAFSENWADSAAFGNSVTSRMSLLT